MPGDKTLGPSQRAVLQKAMAVDVPAVGRQGDPPAWPGPGKGSAKHLAYWADLWSRPVACAWEALQIPPETVARYVVAYFKSLSDHLWAGPVARLERDLGLTPEAMMKMKIRVVDADDADGDAEVTEIDEARRRRIASG